MFERFTERARQAVVHAQDEARSLKHHYIGTEHILLGLLRDDHGVAARVLGTFGVTLEGAREQITLIVGRGDKDVGGQIPFTPRSKKVLELALREALELGDDSIGTEHILLGLVRENEGVAARILLELDVEAEEIRHEVARALTAVDQAVPAGTGHDRQPAGRRALVWEYRVERWRPGEVEAIRLDGLGAMGWQLAGAVPDGDLVQLIFQRTAPADLTDGLAPDAPALPG